ncbi:hypothetical protein [Parapedomonas caeni]
MIAPRPVANLTVALIAALAASPAVGAAPLEGTWRVVAAVPVSGTSPAADALAGMTLVVDAASVRDPFGRRCGGPQQLTRMRGLGETLGLRAVPAGIDLNPMAAVEVVRIVCDGQILLDAARIGGGDGLVIRGEQVLLFLRPEAAPPVRETALPAPTATHDAAHPPAHDAPGDAGPRLRLHLASYALADNAATYWRTLTARVPALAALSPETAPTNIPGKGRMLRLYAVGDAATARTACAAIQAAGAYCQPMPASGNAVPGHSAQ